MMPKIVTSGFDDPVQELNFDSLSDEGDPRLNDSDDSAIGHNISMESLADCEMGHQDDRSLQVPFYDVESKRWSNCFPEVNPLKADDKKSCVTTSPPYKKFRGLLLNGKANITPRVSRRRPSAINRNICSEPPYQRRILYSLLNKKQTEEKNNRPVLANVNPYTPNHQRAPEIKINSCGSRIRSNCSLSSSENVLLESGNGKVIPLEKLKVSQSNISRYKQEFLELEMIGSGVHGQVYKCLNRLDGCVYAVKRTVKPVSHKLDENTAMKEVYAHAVLGKHPHIVRYFSSWAEECHVNIQNEFCNGGSLESMLPTEFTEDQLRTILLHVADGLRYIHSLGLVHLDIKPENVFVSRDIATVNSSRDEAANSSFEGEIPVEIVVSYKIGDLGHVTAVKNPQVEDGDCRYLAKELLNDDYTCLPKSDILALGLMIFELAGGGPLPKNGDRWHELRQSLPPLPNLSTQLNQLLKAMVSPNPTERPTASQILQSLATRTEAEVLQQQLEEERLKNAALVERLDTALNCLKDVQDKNPTTTRSSRLVGRNKNKSKSFDSL